MTEEPAVIRALIDRAAPAIEWLHAEVDVDADAVGALDTLLELVLPRVLAQLDAEPGALDALVHRVLAPAAPFGPYETEADTREEMMPRELRRLHDAGDIRSGDPDHVARGTVLNYLVSTCETAGVTLGAFDGSTLAWLADGETSTAQVLIGLIYRAYASGVEAGRVAARTPPPPPWQQITVPADATVGEVAAALAAELPDDPQLQERLAGLADQTRTTGRLMREATARISEDAARIVEGVDPDDPREE